MIYGHPVLAATRTLRFSDHVTKRNGGSGDENVCRRALLSSALGVKLTTDNDSKVKF